MVAAGVWASLDFVPPRNAFVVPVPSTRRLLGPGRVMPE
jgi:hypothetical protein